VLKNAMGTPSRFLITKQNNICRGMLGNYATNGN